MVAPAKVTVSKKQRTAGRPLSQAKSTTSDGSSSSRPSSPAATRAATAPTASRPTTGAGAPMVVTLDRSGGTMIGCKFMANPLGRGGVAIKAVDAAGQAAGKLVPGDVITHINGKAVGTMAMPAIGALMKKAGAAVRFTLERRAERGASVDDGAVAVADGDPATPAAPVPTSTRPAGAASGHPSYRGCRGAAARQRRCRHVLTPTSYDAVIISDAPDQNMAGKIGESLTKAGLTVWTDPHNREERAFMRQSGWFIPPAKCVLPLLSPNFASSRLCLQELALAALLDKRTVPVSLVPFDQLRLDFHTVLTLSQVEVEFLTSFAMYEATVATVEAAVRAAMAATAGDAEAAAAGASTTTPPPRATSHAAATVDARHAWNLPAVPPHQRLPFWTTAFGHVEQVEWEIFVSALFMHLPILNSVPTSINQSQTQIPTLLARMLPPFGPTAPTHVNRGDLVAAGFPVDKFCGPFAQHVLLIYGTTISAELAFGSGSEVRSLAADAIVATGDKRQAAIATRALVNLAAAVDPVVVLGALTPLAKLHSARFRGRGAAVPPGVLDAVRVLLDHPNFAVKTAAVRAAGDMQLHATKAVLEERYRNDHDITVRDTACRALELLALAIPHAKP